MFVATLVNLNDVVVDKVPLCEDCVKELAVFTIGNLKKHPRPNP
jgi:hypothetical protein